MAGFGASRPLPRDTAKVPSSHRQRPSRFGCRSWSSCPLTTTLRWIGKAVPSCGGCMAIGDSAAGSRNVGSCDVNSLQVARRGRARRQDRLRSHAVAGSAATRPGFQAQDTAAARRALMHLRSRSTSKCNRVFCWDHVCACSRVHKAVLRLLKSNDLGAVASQSRDAAEA
jgi:hypothetical protein